MQGRALFAGNPAHQVSHLGWGGMPIHWAGSLIWCCAALSLAAKHAFARSLINCAPPDTNPPTIAIAPQDAAGAVTARYLRAAPLPPPPSSLS
jgi:hypothetical protein